MEFWTEVRRQVLIEGWSKRGACRQFEISWRTLTKILAHEETPGYQLKQPRPKPKIEVFLPIVAEILGANQKAPRKLRHSAHRILPATQTRQAPGELHLRFSFVAAGPSLTLSWHAR